VVSSIGEPTLPKRSVVPEGGLRVVAIRWLARRLGVPVSPTIILLTQLKRAAPWNAESGPTRVIGIDERAAAGTGRARMFGLPPGRRLILPALPGQNERNGHA
jgi:hypothetical protein